MCKLTDIIRSDQGWPTRPALGAHFRRQQSATATSSSPNHSFCKCILSVAMLSNKFKYEDEIEDLTQWEEEFIFVEKNQHVVLQK